MIEERLAACESRLDAQFSMVMALFQMALRKGLITEAELATTFNGCSTALQRLALETPDLPDYQRSVIDAHLAEIGKLRHHLAV